MIIKSAPEIAGVFAEDAFKLDGFEKAIIGISTEGYIVYCYEKMIDVVMEKKGLSCDEAHTFVEETILHPYLGLGNWTITHPISNYEFKNF